MNNISQNVEGDSLKVMQTLPKGFADFAFIDPPYFLQLSNDLYRPNGTKVAAVDDAWDKFESYAESDEFTKQWLLGVRHCLKPDGSLVVISSYHNVFRVGTILQNMGFWIMNDIIWERTNPLPNLKGTRLCNATETMIWAVPSKGVKPKFNYRVLKSGNDDLQMRNVWQFPACGGKERIKDADGNKAHNTQKPEALLYRLITMLTDPGDIVLDCFGGSGTTAAVAKRLGRHYVTIDNDPKNVKITEARLATVTQTEIDVPMQEIIGTPPKRVPFISLVERGLLCAGQVLLLKGTKHSAVILSDGTIQSFHHRGSIHKVAALLLKQPSCNGWTAWEYHDTQTSQMKLINEFRLNPTELEEQDCD